MSFSNKFYPIVFFFYIYFVVCLTFIHCLFQKSCLILFFLLSFHIFKCLINFCLLFILYTNKSESYVYYNKNIKKLFKTLNSQFYETFIYFFSKYFHLRIISKYCCLLDYGRLKSLHFLEFVTLII